MAADYRDELAAAHARIADLDDKVRALEAAALEPDLSAATRFPELEAAVERARIPADEKRSARRVAFLQMTSAALPIAGLVFSLLHFPLVATSMSVIFIATVVVGFVTRSRLKPAKLRLAEAEQRLADARKLHLLEQKLAATEARTRVALEEEQEEESEPSAEALQASVPRRS